ncbi:hypothetical protein MVEN_01746600 [Mycena venus]|uniref:Uncharacterized protein n=1 Tax=Mycena venus TaxID=2733690 RepID=A0A8H6XK95_9AGAR|nr:hypothetical protein MVEN_01746600 [Mycena venus]
MQLSFKSFVYAAAAMAINAHAAAVGSAKTVYMHTGISIQPAAAVGTPNAMDIRGETSIQPEALAAGTVCTGPALNGTCATISISATGSCTNFPSGFGDNVESITITNPGLECTFYLSPNCDAAGGWLGPMEWSNGGYVDLAGTFLDKTLTCYTCDINNN